MGWRGGGGPGSAVDTLLATAAADIAALFCTAVHDDPCIEGKQSGTTPCSFASPLQYLPLSVSQLCPPCTPPCSCSTRFWVTPDNYWKKAAATFSVRGAFSDIQQMRSKKESSTCMVEVSHDAQEGSELFYSCLGHHHLLLLLLLLLLLVSLVLLLLYCYCCCCCC